jgi:tetratricopeptide (TPR) repeat protein
MGRVYRAVDVELERPVAIKLLGSRTVNDPAFLDRFRREARLAAQLNHPNIATVYAFGEENGETYIAMEFVEGETLTDRLARGPLSIAEVRKYGRQAAAALAVAHEKGIVHRDIKPGNLMINRQGELKVMDFGVARRSGETELTMAGSLIGTANIMAPELVRGEEATPAADLFSLGCVLYEMITGRPAFEGETALAILFQVANDEPPPLDTLRADLPVELRDLVQGLLVKDPAARFGPAGAVAERLDDGGTFVPAGTLALPPGGAGTMVLPAGAGTGVVTTRRWPALVMGGLGVVVAVGLAGLWLFLRHGQEARETEARALNQEGEALFHSQHDKAMDLFRQATAADAGYAPAWNNIGLLKFADGDTAGATAALQEAVKRDSKYAVARFNLADIYRQMGRGTDAEALYTQAISINDKYPEAYWGLARVKEAKGDTTGAIRAYESAIVANPRFDTAYNDLGFLLAKAGHPDSAEVICRKGVALFPQHAYLQKNLGEALRAQGKFADADSAYSRALRLNKDNFPLAQIGLALVAEAEGDRKRALALWGALAGSNDPVVRDQAAAALVRLKSGS